MTEDSIEHEDDLYEALGVRPRASDGEIKQAFRVLARDLHPDRHPEAWGPLQRARAAEQWRRALSAWEILGNRAERAAYDERLQLQEERRARVAEEDRAGARLRAELGQALVARRERDAAPERAPGRTAFNREQATHLQAEYAVRRLHEQRDAALAQVYSAFDTPRPGANLAHRVVLTESQWRDGVGLRSPIDGGLIELPRFTPPGPHVIEGRGGEGVNGGPRGELHVIVEHAPPGPFARGGDAPQRRGRGRSFRWAAGLATLGVLIAVAVVLAAAALLRIWSGVGG